MNQVMIYQKGMNHQLSENFNQNEFDCQCTNPLCHYTLIDVSVVERLQKVRTKWGKPLKITSGFRCQAHNEEVGGTLRSYHTKGMAVDIAGNETNLEYTLRNFFNFVKVYSEQKFYHCDVR